jgi:hypothetical protein
VTRIEPPETVTLTLEQFQFVHWLALEILRRDGDFRGTDREYYAHFTSGVCGIVEVKGKGVLIGESGEGRTEKQAIRDYVRRIAGETLVVDAMRNGRREIKVPRLTIVPAKRRKRRSAK